MTNINCHWNWRPFKCHPTKWSKIRKIFLWTSRLQSMVHHRMLTHFFTFNFDFRVKCTQNVAKVPSTSCDICTSKVWSCYIQWYRRCIYNNIICPVVKVTWNIALSNLCIMWPLTCKVWSCYVQQSWRRWIYKKIHYLTFNFEVKVTKNDAQYPLQHVTYAPAKFEAATPNG